ncbi:MAG TPA: alpha/beta fold hydrolase [Vicinamibacterales bacterium]|jgi:alpha-beta hydrolase superfamily lysophospholipase
MREHATLVGAERGLVTIVTDPPRSAAEPGNGLAAIFLNAGVIHRVGPSRLYVQLARELARDGWVGARFDHAGIGDSPARRDGLPFEECAISEVREVMDSLEHTRGIRRFVLIGLCSGAVTAFEAAGVDPRVVGAVLINPQGFNGSLEWNTYVVNRAQARKYWTRSLFSVASWRKALTGRADYRRICAVLWQRASAARSAEPRITAVATRVATRLHDMLARGVKVLLVCSEGDEGFEYMRVILGRDVRRMTPANLTVATLPGADHSLTLRDGHAHVLENVRSWSAGLTAPAAASEGREAGQLAGVTAGAAVSS